MCTRRAHVGRLVRHTYYLTFVTFIISSYLIYYLRNILTQLEVTYTVCVLIPDILRLYTGFLETMLYLNLINASFFVDSLGRAQF